MEERKKMSKIHNLVMNYWKLTTTSNFANDEDERSYTQSLLNDIKSVVNNLPIQVVSDCYSELQMRDSFEAGCYYERSCVAHEEAKKEKGPFVLMGNDTPDFSEFMHNLNNC